ncbi:hypothetical protein CALVIDRAFT_533135 [Calocera viscosa TUFC12733]|uniref:Uncharacterized protein n=1 Tax=Calocera viscosa (strain TUFC12733) TaxID=1330018 RepID=A0A167RDR6_CALVF|nr:hypothetical protein CALVIDRAFT_533135 [Calocera viscosa TUFC12733]
MSIQPYNISLGEESPTFQYTPVRDGPVTEGWNSSYSGQIEWSGLEGKLGIGTPYRRTELNGAGFSLVFHGTALYLCLSTNSGAGYALTIDNNAVTKTASASDQACSSFPGSEVLVVADGLSYGSHTAEFNATISGTGPSVDFYGGVVTLSAGPSGTTVSSSPLVVDNQNPEWVYEGTWYQGPGTAEITGTHSFTCQYDSAVTVSLTFNGSSIVQLIGTLTSNVFGYSVDFDNVETVYNGSNYWWAAQQTMFFAGGLDPTQSYTLTLIDFDANQPSPPGGNNTGCVNLEAVLLVQATLPNTQSTPSSGPSIPGTATSPSSGASHSSGADTGGNGQSGGGLSGGAIAGIVIGALAVLALIIAVWFLVSRMRKRSSAQGASGQAVFTRGSTPHPPDPIPYITPVQSSFTIDAPVSSVSGGAALSAGYRTEKSPRSIPNNAAYGGVRSSPGPLSEGETPSSSDPRLANEMLQNAPTVDLVTILNQRLRREQADNIEEPPTYG